MSSGRDSSLITPSLHHSSLHHSSLITHHSSLITHGHRGSPIPPPSFLKRKPRPALLRHLHPILADLARDDGDVAEVEVHVIIDSAAGEVSVGKGGDVISQLL